MNRKLLNGLLVMAVAAGGVGTFTSCKDEDFNNNVLMTELSLQAQIDAIRNSQKQDFQDWLDDLTKQYSEGEFENYEAMVQGATELWQVYQSILSDELSDQAAAYVDALYQWMFDRNIKTSDWYNLIFKIAERPTSLGINQVNNPIFGTVNLPLGIKSTLLGTYIYNGKEMSFPTELTPDNFSDASELSNALDPDGLADVLAVIADLKPEPAELVNGSFTPAVNFGNMGGSVITINPSAYNFADITQYPNFTVELVNSHGETVMTTYEASEDEDAAPATKADATEEAPVKELEFLQYTDQDPLLTFGTRAATANPIPGLYKLNVNATAENYEQFLVDFKNTGLGSDLGNIFKDKSFSSVAELAKKILDKFNNSLTAYAVKYSWEEKDIDPVYGDNYVRKDGEIQYQTVTDENDPDAEPVEVPEQKPDIVNSIQSEFDLAAAVVKPLGYQSFSALKDYLPSPDKIKIINNPISYYLDKVRGKIDFDFNMDEYKLNDVTVTFDVQIKDGYVYFEVLDENGNRVPHDPIKIEYDGDGINASDADLNALLDAVLDAMSLELESSINYDMIKQINDTLDKINDKITDAQKKANDWLDKIEKYEDYAQRLLDLYNSAARRVKEFLTNPGHYVQVAMLYDAGEGPHLLSNDVKMGDIFDANATLNLVTTSYTGDIVVPSYKKYVAVTGVADDKNATEFSTTGLSSYNTGDLNKVFDGTNEKIDVDLTPMKGKKVRLTYISVGYDGMCSAENYYLYVNE